MSAYRSKQSRTFQLGKIAYNGNRRINMAEIKICLWYDDKSRPVFSASGDIWNSRHTDIVCGGQCFDTLSHYFHHNRLFALISNLWTRNHLNDMNAGTPEQTKALMEGVASEELKTGHNYDDDCAYLKSHGLYTVTVEGKPYDYGTSWLYRPISEDDMASITNLLQNGPLAV